MSPWFYALRFSPSFLEYSRVCWPTIIDKPQIANKAVTSGAIAGGLAGIGAVIGNSAGLLIRTFIVFTPKTITDMITQLTGTTYTETIRPVLADPGLLSRPPT